ncbi:MAG TPA: polysaccharide biosynthesis tyrosine autokinase [Anaerolineales bacterium]|nr:polysaccharide biosynthesis tyrosine autokinase [Anaerolineales bacterium]
MELKQYILPLRRWWWLLIAATLIAAASSYLATLRQPPIYQTLSTLMIGQVITDPNPTGAEFTLSRQLAENYAEIANREPVKIATMEALGLSWLPDYRATALPNGQFIEVVVTDTLPERAQAVANEIARQLILRSPTGSQSDEQDRQAFVQTQLDNLQLQITETENEIQILREALGGMDSARQIADTQAQITALEAKLADLQGIYSGLLANTQSGAINSISVIEEAYKPVVPIGPNKMLIILLSATVGLSLAVVAAFVLEYIDDTVKSPEEVEKLTLAPVIGYLSELDITDVGALYAADNPRHPSVEEMRTLRTNLEFAGVDQPLKTILVTSTEMEVGKTSVAANLAIVMSQAEKSVILVDADLRRPNVYNFYGFQNKIGLTDVFRGETALEDVTKKWSGGEVSVITAGDLPPNPSELLGSKKMSEIMATLGSTADIVIIDGPPFVVADAPVLASKVDGVLLIIRLSHTRKPAISAMMEQISRSGAKVIGVALNRIPARSIGYYTGNPYYSAYYTNEEVEWNGKSQKTGWRTKLNFWPFNSRSNSKSGANNKRVFDEVDIVESDGDAYGWRD